MALAGHRVRNSTCASPSLTRRRMADIPAVPITAVMVDTAARRAMAGRMDPLTAVADVPLATEEGMLPAVVADTRPEAAVDIPRAEVVDTRAVEAEATLVVAATRVVDITRRKRFAVHVSELLSKK